MYIYMKFLLKEEHVVCIQSLFHAPTENDEVSDYEPRDQWWEMKVKGIW